MINFLRITVKTCFNQEKIYELATQLRPDFSWRMGDSDSQGLYITGYRKDFVQLQFWIDDDVVDVTVSVRGADLANHDQNKSKAAFFDEIISIFLPAIGVVGRVTKFE